MTETVEGLKGLNMPIYAPRTEGARQFGAQLTAIAPRYQEMGFQGRINAAQILRAKRDRILQTLARLRQERAAKKAAEMADRPSGGMIGAGLGAVGSVAAAPFTGGASLALMPAFTAGGGALGEIVSPAGPAPGGVVAGLTRAGEGMVDYFDLRPERSWWGNGYDARMEPLPPNPMDPFGYDAEFGGY